MKFIVTYTAYSDSNVDEVWAALADINRWREWDVRLESTQSASGAKAGASYTLKPKAGNPQTIEIVKASDGIFHDKVKLEFGSVETERTVVANGVGGSIVTQTMHANIAPESAKVFQNVFWPEWSQGIIDSTKALANEPARRALLLRHRSAA